jgi:sugar-specific transcriptional regulator TrmB
LKNSWNYRHMWMNIKKFWDIDCRTKFNKNKFIWLEKEVTQYLKKCEIEKISEKKKTNKINEFTIKNCSEKFSDNKILIDTCEIKTAIISEKWCESFENEIKKQECERVKKSLDTYNQMQNDYHRYWQFNISKYLK